MADLVLAAWAGGALCYAGVLRAPGRNRSPWAWAVCLALVWPASLALVHTEPRRGCAGW